MADEDTTETQPVAQPENGKLQEILEKLNDRLAQPAPAPAPATPAAPVPDSQVTIYTPEQLVALRDEGRITDAQMLKRLQDQDRYVYQQQFQQQMSEFSTQQSVLSEIRRYQDARPSLQDASHEDTRKVLETAAEIARDFGLAGGSNDLRAQLRALKQVYGSPDKAKPVQETTRERKATQERSGSSAPSRSTADSEDGPPSWLEGGHRRHFERGIDQGRYKGWNDPQLKRETLRLRAKQEEWSKEKLTKELSKHPLKKAG